MSSLKISGDTSGSISLIAPITGTDQIINLADMAYSSELSAPNGSMLIGYLSPATGAVARTVDDKLNDIVNISDFNGNLLNAINATPIGGTLIIEPGSYTANFAITRSDITIIGSGMPFYNSTYSALTGGTIIQGTLRITGDRISISNLGIDCGLDVSTSLFAGVAKDCLVLNDTARATHYNCTIRDVITLCKSPTDTVHNFLFEGLSDSRFENLHARYGQWGVVMKTLNSTADGLYAYACSKAGFTIKSDTGVYGAPANKNSVSNVYVDASDYTSPDWGILIYPATASMTDVTLNNFIVTGCVVGLKLVCDSRAVNVNLLSSVVISNGILKNATTFGISTFGAIKGVLFDNIYIYGVTSNAALDVGVDCLGISLANITANVGVAGIGNITLRGCFGFTNLQVLVNGSYTSLGIINCIPDSASTFKVGTYTANLADNGVSGALSWVPTFTGLTTVAGDGAVNVTGRYYINGNRLFFHVLISCTGTTSTSASAGSGTTYINNLPYTVQDNEGLTCINGIVQNGGIGLINAGTTNAYTSTWTAYHGTVVVSGNYRFQ